MAYITFQPSDYFNTKLYTGTGSSNAQTGVGFQPDWLWIKDRDSGSNSHIITDAIRGTNKIIFTDSNGVELTDANRVTSFNSDGFTVGTDGSTNTNTNDYVSWNCKANGQGSSNTDGSINTTYTSANTTSGFSISTYVGTGGAATIGHGLGAIPQVILVKNVTSVEHWVMYHHKSHATPEDNYLRLNSSNAVADFDMWNDTAPTNQVFSISNNGSVGASGDTYVAYCFTNKKGFFHSGTYTGTGSTSSTPFVYTGFKPSLLIVKRTDSSAHWQMTDNKISFNGVGSYGSNFLSPSQNNAEGNGYGFMLHSNGFSFHGSDSASATVNGSGASYIYLAWASEPLVSSNGVPATAR